MKRIFVLTILSFLMIVPLGSIYAQTKQLSKREIQTREKVEKINQMIQDKEFRFKIMKIETDLQIDYTLKSSYYIEVNGDNLVLRVPVLAKNSNPANLNADGIEEVRTTTLGYKLTMNGVQKDKVDASIVATNSQSGDVLRFYIKVDDNGYDTVSALIPGYQEIYYKGTFAPLK